MTEARRRRALTSAWRVPVLLVGLLAVAVVALALPRALHLPSISPQDLATPSTLIVAWVGAVIAAQAGFEPVWELYPTAGARVRVVNLARIAVVAVLTAVICTSILSNVLMTVTALSWLLGLALVGAAVVGHQLAWVAPTAYLLVVVGAGAVDPVGAPRLWAAPANPQPTLGDGALAALVLVLGAVAWWWSASRQARLQRHG